MSMPALHRESLWQKLRGRGPTERVAEYSHARHVEPSRELSGGVRGAQPSEAIEHELMAALERWEALGQL